MPQSSSRMLQDAAPTRKLWIKICANTNLPDALLAAELGADAVGFVFAPSPRQVNPEQVAAITQHLPRALERVGVFTGSTPEDLRIITAAVEYSGLTAVQLHGGVNLAFAAALQTRLGSAVSIIHTASWEVDDHGHASSSEVSAQLNALAGGGLAQRALIDAQAGGRSGGLGLSFDWSRAVPVFQAYPSLRLILAGGLQPGNITEAITQLNLYGVDVASGVEERPGKKDPAKLSSFMQKARGAI